MTKEAKVPTPETLHVQSNGLCFEDCPACVPTPGASEAEASAASERTTQDIAEDLYRECKKAAILCVPTRAEVIANIAAALSAASEEAERRRTEECARLVCEDCAKGDPPIPPGEVRGDWEQPRNYWRHGGRDYECDAEKIWLRWPPATSEGRREGE